MGEEGAAAQEPAKPQELPPFALYSSVVPVQLHAEAAADPVPPSTSPSKLKRVSVSKPVLKLDTLTVAASPKKDDSPSIKVAAVKPASNIRNTSSSSSEGSQTGGTIPPSSDLGTTSSSSGNLSPDWLGGLLNPTATIAQENSPLFSDGPEGAAVALDGTASYAPWGSRLTSYSWEVTNAVTKAPVITYQGAVGEVRLQPGRYRVQLTVTSDDADIGVDWYIMEVLMGAAAPAPSVVDDIAVPPPAAALPGARKAGCGSAAARVLQRCA